ncbi:hypothetical protein I5677_11830 [Mobilitalea sibirica]|uniref:Uncharacterized protein n=1 Tax=Mobilitalea sibirica TaxID=1462919 RepID=A0A8J7HE44_9FIRM|nr:hypothetical protein [Mobilitalea sibirica]MBH1941584.1 hypothetical protein [Mobilitalea sibirica]
MNKNNNMYREVRNWIYRNARLLDIARWKYHFEYGNADEVLQILMEYQNEDGGFGRGLEADSWNPLSTPIQTMTAIELLQEIEYTDKNHPIIQGILTYLGSGADFNGSMWYNVVLSNNDYPHAPWWTADKDRMKNPGYNPTAALAGFALCYADRGSTLFKKCERIVKDAITYLNNETEISMHTLACYVILLEYCEQANITNLYPVEQTKELLNQHIQRTITTNKDSWVTDYICKPSMFLNSPKSMFYLGIKEIADYECEFIEKSRNKEGVWDINWNWGEYPEQWPIAKNWWQGHLAIENMLYLKNFNRL